MTLTFTVSAEDYIAQQIRESKRAAKHIFAGYLVFVLAIAALLTIWMIRTDAGERWWELVRFFIVAVLMLVVLIVFYRLFPTLLRTLLKGNNLSKLQNKGWIGPQSLTLGNSYVEKAFNGKVNRIPYRKIKRVERVNNCLSIYYDLYMAYIVPLSAFANTQQRDDFLAALRQKTGLSAL